MYVCMFVCFYCLFVCSFLLLGAELGLTHADTLGDPKALYSILPLPSVYAFAS